MKNEIKFWPADGIEHLNACPVCGKGERQILYDNLYDKIFFCAPGKWTMWLCQDCQCAYLDPRPNRESIHLAYETYYTHGNTHGNARIQKISLINQFKKMLGNGYRNWRYAANEQPSLKIGVILAYLLPFFKRKIDASFRHIPRPKENGRLLDIGCGDGAFLLTARAMGWVVEGVDFDEVAVNAAKQKGLNVFCGGIHSFDERSNQFDVITMNHVIEHVHDPVGLLKDCYRLLKPGGRVQIETPNINSSGHSEFKRDWRGLEPPRHLVLFNRDAINALLANIGFINCHFQAPVEATDYMFASSYRMRVNLDPHSESEIPYVIRQLAKKNKIIQKFSPDKSEFLSIVGTKS